MKNVLIFITLFYLQSTSLFSQNTDTLSHKKAQFTFAYPVGSNGINSTKYSNNVSFNVLYGLNGGFQGVEMASLFNYNQGNASGVQLGGLLNFNTGRSSGLFLSGITNYFGSNSRGWQLAGISNIGSGPAKGVSVSGAFNFNQGTYEGVQISPINIVQDTVKGFQLGVVNIDRKLEGFGFGVINILQNGESGIPLGVINIVKKGYYALEISAGETIYSNLTFKMGVEKLYTIFKAGYSQFNSEPIYSTGLGFGTLISIADKHKVAIDLSSSHFIYDNQWESDLNLLNKADVNYQYYINETLSLHIGPSINAYITQIVTEEGFGTINIPYTLFSRENANRKFTMWAGLNAGLSFRF